MGVSIWEGQKATDLIDAVKKARNDVGITQNFADALLNVLNNVGYVNTNGAIALEQLRETMNAILSDSFVSMVDYIALPNYGPADSPNSWYGAVARNDRSLLVSEFTGINIPAKTSTQVTEYDTTLPYSFIKVPAGATQIKQINTAGVSFNLRPLIYENGHFIISPLAPSTTFFGAPNNTYKDITTWNDGNHYFQGFSGSIADGTAAAVIFR